MLHLILCEWDAHDWRGSSDALADWLNARWRKTGYVVQSEDVWALLAGRGREACMGKGDWLRGRFVRD